MAETSLDIKIRPGISPDDRHQLEDLLESKGLDIAGGGGFGDGSESDIMAYSNDVRVDLPIVIGILRKANVGENSCVIQGGRHTHDVYGEIEVAPEKPWWPFW